MEHQVEAWEHSPEIEQGPQDGLWTLSLKQGTLNQIQLTMSSQPKKEHCLSDNGLGSHIPCLPPDPRGGPGGEEIRYSSLR